MTTTERWVAGADGWGINVLEVPAAGRSRGLVIAGHAMMVDRRTLVRDDRPSLVASLT